MLINGQYSGSQYNLTDIKWLELYMLKRLLPTIAFTAVATSTFAAQDYGVQASEKFLLDGLRDLRENRLESALENLRSLTAQRPDYRLAQLIYGDLMQAHTGPLKQVGSEKVTDSKLLDGLMSEARVRLLTEQEKPGANMLPSTLIKTAANQRYIILMDTRLSRLFVFQNKAGVPVLVKDYYASYGRGGVGKVKRGDLKTPVGVYFVTGRLSDSQLPQRYGSGALPVNYPNVWDKRQKRTGSGIWVHGSPFESYTRPPKASEGCISLSNPDFQELNELVDAANTPVIVGDNISWMNKGDWQQQKAQYDELITGWRDAWQSRNHRDYIQYYSKTYKDSKHNFQRFNAHKRRVNSAKTFINVDLDNLSIYRYPDEPLMVVTFNQRYTSNNYKSEGIKRQYWKLEQGRWKIAYEGEPSKGVP